MKGIVVLLSLLILFLNAIPCCWDECSEDVALQHTEQSGASQDACSPFLSCGSCTGFTLEKELPQFSIAILPAVKNPQDCSRQLFETDYSGIIWEPPKEFNGYL